MAEKALDCLEVTEQVTKTNKTNLIEDEITQNVRIKWNIDYFDEVR